MLRMHNCRSAAVWPVAIHSAAGPGLAEECRPMAPIRPGEAVLSGGHNLPNPYVIHCLGPIYGVDRPEDKYLADCYRNALQLADENEIDSIAFPSISTGAFGYPVKEAAAVAVAAIKECLRELRHVKKIRIVLFSDQDLEKYGREQSKLPFNRLQTNKIQANRLQA